MDKGLYVAMTGAQATLRAQAAVANNLANKDTAGFKAERFGTQAFEIPGAGLPTRVDALTAAAGYDATGGALLATGNDTDIALRDGVWLGVADASGREALTRGGELRLSPNGVLTTAAGRPVLSEAGAPLAVPPHSKLSIGQDGTVSIQPLGQGPETVATVGRLRLGQVERPEQLERGEDGLMRAREPLPQATGNALSTGALEGSNVDTAATLVDMIDAQRGFERRTKLISTAEQLDQSSARLMSLS